MNRLWLVCKYHPIKSESFCIATNDGEGYCSASRVTLFDAWLSKHAECGGNHDHFSLSYDQTQDWKLETIGSVISAVHTELNS